MKAIIFATMGIILAGCSSNTNIVSTDKTDSDGAPVLVKPKKAILVRPLIFHKTLENDHAQAKDAAIKGIKHFEGFFAKAYVCLGKRKTVGYGFTDKHFSKTITRQRADYLLEHVVWDEYAAYVDKHVKVKLTPYQRAALVMFVYNVGEGNLKKLVNGPDRLNSGNYKSVPTLMSQYTKAKGKTLPGLVRRRAWEAQLWAMN